MAGLPLDVIGVLEGRDGKVTFSCHNKLRGVVSKVTWTADIEGPPIRFEIPGVASVEETAPDLESTEKEVEKETPPKRKTVRKKKKAPSAEEVVNSFDSSAEDKDDESDGGAEEQAGVRPSVSG